MQGISILGAHVGGGIFNRGNLTLNCVTLTGNDAINVGGGLNNIGGRALIVRSIIQANTAPHGSGLWNGPAFPGGPGGTLTVFETLVAGNNANNAPGQGGGVFADADGSTNITQSVIEKNTAAGQGGRIYNNTGAKTSLDRSLVEQNKADLGTFNSGGGIFDAATPGGVAITRTIVRTNTPNNCTPTIPGCLVRQP